MVIKKKEDLEVVLMCPSFVEIPFRIERRYEFYVIETVL
jgi:hypothetical protein